MGVTADFKKSGRTITQSTTLPDGRALTTTFKWGNDNNWLNNHIELDLAGTERNLDSKFEWNFGPAAGTWKLDAVVTTIDVETTTSTGQASTQTMEVSGPLMLMEQHFGKQTMSKLMSSSSWTPARLEMENWMPSQLS